MSELQVWIEGVRGEEEGEDGEQDGEEDGDEDRGVRDDNDIYGKLGEWSEGRLEENESSGVGVVDKTDWEEEDEEEEEEADDVLDVEEDVEMKEEDEVMEDAASDCFFSNNILTTSYITGCQNRACCLTSLLEENVKEVFNHKTPCLAVSKNQIFGEAIKTFPISSLNSSIFDVVVNFFSWIRTFLKILRSEGHNESLHLWIRPSQKAMPFALSARG